MRVVLIAQVAPAVQGLYAELRARGHEPVALLTARAQGERYGAALGALVAGAPADLDVVVPSRRDRIAPLLRLYDPDVAFCAGFPWKIPSAALAVPRYGVVNGHPSLLPRYRGPSPVAWAIREGESEVGFTFHYMDAGLDTGNVLAQTSVPLAAAQTWDDLTPRLVAAVGELLPRVLERVEAGDPGDPQPDGAGEHRSFFEPEYAWIDRSRPVAEVERQVRAWRFHPAGEPHGALVELDGKTVRVLRVSREVGDGPALPCADGTLWIVESEPA